MKSPGGGGAVPRMGAGAGGHAAIQLRTVEIVFRKYPGTDAAGAIQGLDYKVKAGSGPETAGTTGADGKVTVRVPGWGTVKLTVMDTEYKLEPVHAIEDAQSNKGVQRRLNMLGYNAGAIDGIVGKKTEYAALNYQADNSPLKIDGIPGPKTSLDLKKKVGE